MRRSCRRSARRGASRSGTWTSSDAAPDLRHAEARIDRPDPGRDGGEGGGACRARRRAGRPLRFGGARGRARRTCAFANSVRRPRCSAALDSPRRFARELTPRPLGVVAHMIPLYVIVAAPLVRPRRIPVACSGTRTGRITSSSARQSVWRRPSSPSTGARSRSTPRKVRRARPRDRPGGVHMHRAARAMRRVHARSCSDGTRPRRGSRRSFAAPPSPAASRLEAHGSTGDGEYDEHKRYLERLAAGAGAGRRSRRAGAARGDSRAVRAQPRADQQHARRRARQGRLRGGGVLPARARVESRLRRPPPGRASLRPRRSRRVSRSGCGRSTAAAGPSCARSWPRTTRSSTGPTACWLPLRGDEARRRSPPAEGGGHLRLGGAPARAAAEAP